jgi:predicted anti-sigma-YlaC factor YlaD
MMGFWHRSAACDRARQWISLRLDDELSELDGVRLNRHLARCEDCQGVAAGMSQVTELLRDAPLVEPRSAVVVPFARPSRARMLSRVGVGVAATAAAFAAIVTAGGPTGSASIVPQFRNAHEEMEYVRSHDLQEPQALADVVQFSPQVTARSL